MARIVVVGAGPAGIAAASVLSESGAKVSLIDEGQRPGGQVHRSPAAGLKLDMRQLLGTGFEHYEAFHATATAVCAQVDYRPGTLAWSVSSDAVHVASDASGEALPYEALILATGATDRVMPATGWTLPGIFSLGGAQALLKDQGCLIGRNPVFCGSSPLLYLAACQYLRMNGKVAAVIDTTRFSAKVRAIPNMLAAPGTFVGGLGHMARLRARGVPVLHGATIEGFDGEDRVAAVLVRKADGSRQRIACDAAAVGHGLKPETQLAELAGCALRFDPVHRTYVPVCDLDGRARKGIYIAGDGGMIGGVTAARISGTLAGVAALSDLGMASPSVDVKPNRRALARLRRFQSGLATAFRWPGEEAASLDDSVILCRCENITVGEVRTILELPVVGSEANRIKAASRCGMGRCQGRFCGPVLGELSAAGSDRSDSEPSRLRAQAPVKPLPIRISEGAAP